MDHDLTRKPDDVVRMNFVEVGELSVDETVCEVTREYWINHLAKAAPEVRVSRAVDLLMSQSRKIAGLHSALAARAVPVSVPHEVTCPHCGMPFEVEP